MAAVPYHNGTPASERPARVDYQDFDAHMTAAERERAKTERWREWPDLYHARLREEATRLAAIPCPRCHGAIQVREVGSSPEPTCSVCGTVWRTPLLAEELHEVQSPTATLPESPHPPAGTFASILPKLVEGRAARRTTWSEGLYLVYLPPTALAPRRLNERALRVLGAFFEGTPAEVAVEGYFVTLLTTSQPIQWRCGWTATAADLLATDWILY